MVVVAAEFVAVVGPLPPNSTSPALARFALFRHGKVEVEILVEVGKRVSTCRFECQLHSSARLHSLARLLSLCALFRVGLLTLRPAMASYSLRWLERWRWNSQLGLEMLP